MDIPLLEGDTVGRVNESAVFGLSKKTAHHVVFCWNPLARRSFLQFGEDLIVNRRKSPVIEIIRKEPVYRWQHNRPIIGRIIYQSRLLEPLKHRVLGI